MKKKTTSVFVLPLLLTGACHKQAPTVSLHPPATPAQVTIAVPVPTSPLSSPPAKWPSPPEPPPLDKPLRPAPAVYQTAENDFENARYVLAARSYEAYLKDYPSRGNEDRVLFRLGVAYALSDDTPTGLRKSRNRLERLTALYPDSPYKPQAKLILDLQNQLDQKTTELQSKDDQIKQLKEEFDKLKRIDLQRQPSRPPR